MTKQIEASGYDFKPKRFPELDAINELIKSAYEYAVNGNLEKSKELYSKAEVTLNKITKKSNGRND